jgi:hypothetical protein
MKNWFNPLNGVYTAIAAIVGGLSIWRIRKRKMLITQDEYSH